MSNLEIFFQIMILIKFLLLFIFQFHFANGSSCPSFMCGNNGSVIRFPFKLHGQDFVDCSYPGFDLFCNGTETAATLRLQYSGDFLVRDIDYVTQEIQLYDRHNCLPRQLLDLNLSHSPFTAVHYRNYTFLSCPSHLVKSKYTLVDCLSNSTTSVLATSSMSLAASMLSSCTIMVTMPMPVSLPVKFEDSSFSDLGSDLHLTWKAPDCRDCEGKGGTCGINNNTVKEIVCLYNKEQAGSKEAGDVSVFIILATAIMVPAMACALGIALFICITSRVRQTTTHNTISPQPTTIISTGLDDITIESYRTLVLGESKRLPGRNDGTCPICLADYCTKDTLRCIPECTHCFHAECIDEWLRMHNSCPVCRNAPSPARMN